MSIELHNIKDFSWPSKALEAGIRLERLIVFAEDMTASSQMNSKYLSFVRKVSSIWSSFQVDSTSDLELIKTDLMKQFKVCFGRSPIQRTLPREFCTKMNDEISKVDSFAQLELRQKEILKDCRTLEIVPRPIQKASTGLFGPTLLVNYPNPGQDLLNQVNYVLKWTGKQETVSYAVYQLFLSNLDSLNLTLPEYVWFDFDKEKTFDPHNLLRDLESKDAKALECSYSKIPKLLDSEMKINGEQLLILERICGENLAEFARFNYGSELSEHEKKDLFFEFGKIALLDLFLGNSDRLIQIGCSKDFEPYLDDYESNFGNLMFAKREDSETYSIYLIDNAIDQAYIENPENRNHYLSFLRTLMSEASFEEKLSKMIAKSFKKSFESLIEQRIEKSRYKKLGNRDLKEGDDALTIIKKDLEDFATPLIERGILNMFENLKEQVTTLKAELAILKENLGSQYPEYFFAIEERLVLLEGLKGR